MEIDTHLGCAMSGLTADARTMVDHARVTAQNHAFTYDERIKVESVTQAVCDLALRFGESVHDEEAMMSRPFGVALLIGGIDEFGPQLYVFSACDRMLEEYYIEETRYHTDPSGTFIRYEAKAIGSGSEAAQSELQDKWHKVCDLLHVDRLDSLLFPANDIKGSPNPGITCPEASDGGETGSTQCTISTGQ